ncbi:MAG: hypothetical protein PSU94_17250 [Lacunisphaera sp.]|nr:hypothetical protein [Lacunisphaera sp.]
MKKLSKKFYLISLILGGLAVMGAVGQIAEKGQKFGPLAAQREMEESLGPLLLVIIYLTVVVLRLFYQAWQAIQDGHARTTPGKAVGLLLVPFFNLYWMFVAIYGFANDFNAYVDRHALSVRKLPAGLFLTYLILVSASWIPFLGVAASVVAFVLLVIIAWKICDGVNALIDAAAAGAAVRPAGLNFAEPPPLDPPTAAASATDFLSSLSLEEKLAVNNLPQVDYQAVINEKTPGAAPLAVISDNPQDAAGMAILRKVSVADIQRLKESVRLVMKADEVARSGGPTAFAGAARLYGQAAEINPFNDLAQMSCGVALARSGNLREGVQWVEKAVQTNPGNERARGNLQAMRRGP